MFSRGLITNLTQALKQVKPTKKFLPYNVVPSLLRNKLEATSTDFQKYVSLQNITRHLSTYTKIQKLITQPPVTQGVYGPVELITGNFSYLTKEEGEAIKSRLHKSVLIILFDRDTIPVPANERAMWIREYCQYHPNLEIRIAYGAPSEKEGNEEQYIPFIKKQLPAHIQITEICCNNSYSTLLAKSLRVPFNPIQQLKNSKTIEQEIRKNPSHYKNILLPQVAQRVISPFQQIIDEDEFKQLYNTEKAVVKVDLEQLNTDHPNQDSFFNRTRWDLTALNRVNLPIVIGTVGHKYRLAFSNRTNAQVFDMPIYMPGQGWKIPVELAPYKLTLAKIAAAESLANNLIEECNAYITIDCGIVFPNGYARREGLHVDGFLTKANARSGKDGVIWGDNTYIVSDAQDLQTEFYPGPFDLSSVDIDNPQSVLKAFENQGRIMRYQQANAYHIVKLTTNNVHAVHPNLSGRFIERCFLKMTFSERLFNRSGNTINPNFNYRFMYVPRSTGRNTQNFTGIPPKDFLEVDLREIDFNGLKFPHWVSSTPFWVRKKPDVRITAVSATEGEFLETKIDNQIITTNIARAGDMKVTRSDGDSYFLGTQFKKLYQPMDSSNEYVPTPRILKAVRIMQNISFLANWGTRQNIPEGGCIVQDNQGDTWGVHQQSFEATYENSYNTPSL